MLDAGFVPGLVIGFLTASVFGAIARIIRDEMDKAGKAGKKQPVIQLTEKTPAEVVSESRAARFNLLLIFLLLTVAFLCAITGAIGGIA